MSAVSRLTLHLAVLALAAGCHGCTSYRIVRYREPDARNQGMFPAREVRAPETPAPFARAAALRADLDTVSVRAATGTRMPFAQYLTDHKVLAFVVIRNDTIVYETYRDGMTDSTVHNSFSVAKSVLSALVGIAIDEGKIRSLDDRVTEYVPELRSKPAFDGVTLRHLIDMKSGLRFSETGGGMWSDFRSDEARIYYTTDLLETIAGAPRVAEPGTIWDYKDTDAELLGIALARAVGKSVSAYTEEKLWRRIGAEHDATWHLDHKNGQEKTSTGFNATARDFARFGQLYLNGGVHGGEQIVPAAWVAQSAAPDPTRPEPEVSTWWKMQHTLYWWHPIQPPAGEFYADGSNGQRVFVDPKTRTVIVQLANQSAQDFPFRKIVAYLTTTTWMYPQSIPALVRQVASNFGADSVRPVFSRLEAARQVEPTRYIITRNAMFTVGTLLAEVDSTRRAGIEVLTLSTELYADVADGFVRLFDACTLARDVQCAAQAIARASAIAPNNPEVLRRKPPRRD